MLPPTSLDAALLKPPPDKPSHRPFPEVAQALRDQAELIMDEWRGRTIFSMPELGELSVKEFKDDIARILSAMADALESNEQPDLRRLVQAAPAHGFHRFMQEYDLVDMFAEERVLRRVIVSRVEDAIRRQCKPDEAGALHSMIDIMLQQGVLALVQQQKQELQKATEVQLKYLSFLSHDLSKNFAVIMRNLESIGLRLAKLPDLRECNEVIAASLTTLAGTREGMSRLLEHERLRNSDVKPALALVKLRDVIEPIVKVAADGLAGKEQRIDVDVDAEAAAYTNADLVTLIVQNLVWNALKQTSERPSAASGAAVSVEAERQHKNGVDVWSVSVTDDGPGMTKDELDNVFNAGQRTSQPGGTGFGNDGGWGLGLAIASQAARLLGTTIGVTTRKDQGSRFSFQVPMGRA